MSVRTSFQSQILAVTVVLGATWTVSAQDAGTPLPRYTASSQTVLDTKTKLTWQRTAPGTTMALADAQTYCAGLGPTLGGGTWRVPTLKELVTIVDYSQTTAPMIDRNAFPSTAAAVFWSSSAVAGVAFPEAWMVSFSDGTSGDYGTSFLGNVRCVR